MQRADPADRTIVGIAQWLPLPGAAADNLEVALTLMEELQSDCNLIVLPEHWYSGYDPESFTEDVRQTALTLESPTIRTLCDWARARGVYLVPGSFPEIVDGRYFNTTVLISPDGSILARHRKAHLWGAESSVLTPGDSITVCKGTPFGDLGLSICFDGDFPEVARGMRREGARLVIHPCAYDHSAEAWWDRLYSAHALTNGQWWVMANHAGSHDSISFFGRSQVISPQGEIVAEASRAEVGATPAAETLIVEIAREPQPWEAIDSDVLFSALRPDLAIASFRSDQPLTTATERRGD